MSYTIVSFECECLVQGGEPPTSLRLVKEVEHLAFHVTPDSQGENIQPCDWAERNLPDILRDASHLGADKGQDSACGWGDAADGDTCNNVHVAEVVPPNFIKEGLVVGEWHPWRWNRRRHRRRQ